jgi:hypothetical protein
MPDDTRPKPDEDSPIFRTPHSWDSLIEKQIREAMREGQFDNLPHQGKPLPSDDNPNAGAWGLAYKMLKDAGYAPPWIEADKEVRALLERRNAILARARGTPPTSPGRQRDREQLTRLVSDINAAVTRLNSEAPTLAQHRRLLHLDVELAAYDAACGDPPT